MMDTTLLRCPTCGKVRVPDGDVIESLVPGSKEIEPFSRGVGFRCPVCGVGWWKDLYDMRDHWRRYPTGLRP